MKANTKRIIISSLIFIGGTWVVAALAGIMGGKMNDWNGHKLPPLSPPSWLFPIMWSLLYTAIGISILLIYLMDIRKSKKNDCIIWYSINLFFNMFWPLIFFRLDQPLIACILLGVIVITAIITMIKFYNTNLTSGIMYTVYTAWLLFAFYLNLATLLLM